MDFDTTAVIGLILVSFCVATAALIAAAHFSERQTISQPAGFDPTETEAAVFIFDGTLLVDATDRARKTLKHAGGRGSPWQRLISHLSPQFPGIETRLDSLPRGEALDEWSDEKARERARLLAEWRNGLLHLTLLDADQPETAVRVDAQRFYDLEAEAALLEATTDKAPYLHWKTDEAGQVIWANRAYLTTAERVQGTEATQKWPLPRLFNRLQSITPEDDQSERRISLIAEDDGTEETLWFDTASHPMGAETLHFAIAADAAVRAEGALREFIQTLAKTFAHLPIGLAIFDRSRQLVLFNPSLTDLSRLPVAFLSRRPTLNAFLDELRERRVMPEPKDYKSWRQKILELEAEAVNGTYEEDWSLPSGQTYRVSGRPHPEGAIAFLFEDITAEVSLTRRFRADLELGQAVLDAQEEALAVFSPSGILTMSNAAYADIWGVDPSTTLGNIGITDAMRRWLDLSEPTPVWGDARDFISSDETRAAWTAEVKLKAGGRLRCRFVPISGGATLIGFSREDPEPTRKRRLNLSEAGESTG